MPVLQRMLADIYPGNAELVGQLLAEMMQQQCKSLLKLIERPRNLRDTAEAVRGHLASMVWPQPAPPAAP